MVGPLKSSTNGGDEGGLSSSYPGKASGAFLSSLFRSKSRDSDKDTESSRQLSDSTPASSAPSLLPSHNGHPSGQGQHASAKPVKSTDSSSHWLLGRKPSEKKKDRPERLKNALFGHGSQSSGHASKEVKGAVKDDWPMYSGKPEDYEMGETIGFGATSTVRLATYKPLNQVVAVKVMDFEGSSSIRMMQREVELMSLSKHPNILRVRGDWVAERRLCIATRFIPPGSLLDIMEYGFRDGLDEVTCATILKQAADGIHYLHINGWLHRDIKAGNLLIDEDGTVLISDFGCSSQVFTTGNGSNDTSSTVVKDVSPEEIALRTRKSFVGTPSWMAPEVVEQRPYDSKADIWSFGITAIEIATGRAPHSLYTPAQILMKTVAEKPPTLDIEGQAHPFSKIFKDMIDTCLKKDASKRPTAERLLTHPFFRSAKRKSHLVGALLAGLPPIQSRQTRRTRRTLSGLSATRNLSVWDFESSPITDSFKGFTMNHASPSLSSVHTRTGSNNAMLPTPTEERSLSSPPLSGRSPRRRNNSSLISAHKRSISIDPLPERDSPEPENGSDAETAPSTPVAPSTEGLPPTSVTS